MSKISKEVLENSSYQDIAKIILMEKKGGENTLKLFKRICKELEIDEKRMEQEIGDFYTALTIDRRFTMLEDGKWDLKANYSNIQDEDEDEDEDDIYEDEEEDEDEEDESIDEEEDIEEPIDDEMEEDELSDLVIVDEEDLEE